MKEVGEEGVGLEYDSLSFRWRDWFVADRTDGCLLEAIFVGQVTATWVCLGDLQSI